MTCRYGTLDAISVESLHERPNAVEVVAANIRAEVARRGMSQLEFSVALGMAQSAVSRRWNGQRPWHLSDLDHVARVLGVEPWELLRPPASAGGRSWYTARDSNPEPIDLPTAPGGAVIIDLATRRRLGNVHAGDVSPARVG